MRTLLTFVLALCVFAGLNAQTVVEAGGYGNLKTAIDAASDGDVLILTNGGVYEEHEQITINKQITIKAEETPLLPGLANLPKINNLQAVNPFIVLGDGADVTFFGVEIDGNGSQFIFTGRVDGGVVGLVAERCRFHNTTGDIFQEFVENNNQRLSRMIVKNSFLYDTGEGHAMYARVFVGPTEPLVFENITYWNMGQQFTWVRITPNEAQPTHEVIFNHITGYNLSTRGDKELFGNGEDDTRDANYKIKLTNAILHTQNGTTEPSLKFLNETGRHEITIENVYLWECNDIANTGTIVMNNVVEDVDPQFADPANGDFTVGNTALHAAGTGGKIVGAVYWHPDYEDVTGTPTETSVSSQLYSNIGLRAYPNPIRSGQSLNVQFNLNSDEMVSFAIYSVNGQLIRETSPSKIYRGQNTIAVSTNDLAPGIYFGRIQAGSQTQVVKLSVN